MARLARKFRNCITAACKALADQGNDASCVTELRGASPPPVVSTPPVPQVVVQTVVYPEIVYLPAYYPAYSFYPGYFIQPRRFRHQQVSATGLSHSHTK